MTKSENNKRVAYALGVCVCVRVYVCVCVCISIRLWLMVISSHLIYCKMLNFTKRKCLLERKLLFLVLPACFVLLVVLAAPAVAPAGLSPSAQLSLSFTLTTPAALSLSHYAPLCVANN